MSSSHSGPGWLLPLCSLAEQAREAEKTRREAAVKAVEYERTAKEELDLFRAQRAAAKKVGAATALPCTADS